ncbi:MAG TPA: hypothetical protein VGG02_02735 [Chthoniobacterales bacterium]
MRTMLFLTAVLEFAIVSPIPALDRWQAQYRASIRASIGDYLPENPNRAQERASLRDICALPDSAYRPQP